MKIKKRKLILLATCAIIIAVFLAQNIVQKVFLRFAGLEKEIALNEKKLAQLSSILKYSQEINSAYENVFAGYKKIADSDSLLREIEGIANRTNLNILNIKPSVTKEEDLLNSYAIRITAQDEILSVARFLNSLTEELKSVGVERIQINTENKNELPKVTLLINAAVFKD